MTKLRSAFSNCFNTANDKTSFFIVNAATIAATYWLHSIARPQKN